MVFIGFLGGGEVVFVDVIVDFVVNFCVQCVDVFVQVFWIEIFCGVGQFVEGGVEYVDDFCIFVGNDCICLFVLEYWNGDLVGIVGVGVGIDLLEIIRVEEIVFCVVVMVFEFLVVFQYVGIDDGDVDDVFQFFEFVEDQCVMCLGIGE